MEDLQSKKQQELLPFATYGRFSSFKTQLLFDIDDDDGDGVRIEVKKENDNASDKTHPEETRALSFALFLQSKHCHDLGIEFSYFHHFYSISNQRKR